MAETPTSSAANRQESADSGIRKALVAAQTVIDAKDYPDTAALIEVALAGLDDDYSHAYQDEYQRLWHDAAATRDRYKAALKLIYRGYVHAPTISDPWDPQKIAGDVLEVAA